MFLGAWLHTLSPFVLRFNESLGIRWYGVAYLTGFAIAYIVMLMLAKRRLILIPAERVGDAMMWMIVGVLVGGRLGYVFVYDPALLWTFTHSPPWWALLAIHKGGMASHGGIAGVILASFRIARGWKDESGAVVGRAPATHIMDVTALLVPFGMFFGRLANFVNGELLGRIVTPPGVEGPWWTVQFPQELRGWVQPGMREGHAPALNPVQEGALWRLVHENGRPGSSYGEAINNIVEHAGKYASELKPLLASRHPSQLYQAGAEGLVLGAALWLIWARPRKPGVVGSCFFMIYGVLRVITEIWRLPDPQFGEHGRIYGLSRGQWLSVAMVVVGAAGYLWSRRRPTARIGGWAAATREGEPGSPAVGGA
jgi:phosphatidylglycerol---prolipoprotein diacylglyceryl transferase